jgi:hypothetical protein
MAELPAAASSPQVLEQLQNHSEHKKFGLQYENGNN